MDPIDALEALLARGPEKIAAAVHVDAAESLAGLAEFSLVRWQWLSQHGVDLLSVLPRSSRPWRHLQDAGLVLPHQADGGAVCNVPPLESHEWDVGQPFLRVQEDFKSAMVKAGASSAFALMILGAFNEMASNAVEHARPAVSPVATFEVRDSQWTFSVTDDGRGLLESLRSNPAFSDMTDECLAIRKAVEDGVSATGRPGRGHGFTSVFRVLAERRCSIRLRSVSALGHWTGTNPTQQSLAITAVAPRVGFHVRISGPT